MWPFRKDTEEAKARETLQAAGYTGSFRRMRIIAYSPIDKAENVKLHATTNRTLVRVLVDGALGDCIHITGKMNALADPFHRRLCAEVHRSGKTRFQVVYDGSQDPAPGQVAIHSARRWKDVAWNDKLAAVRLIGEQYVDLWTAPTKDVVQYTVFGKRFTQLQGTHQEVDGVPSVAKRIWLIESEEINDFLAVKAKRTLKASVDVREQLFHTFFVRVNGTAAHDILATLRRAGPTSRGSLLTERLRDFDPGVDEVVEGLAAVDLIAEDGMGTFSITDQGRQFLSRAE